MEPHSPETRRRVRLASTPLGFVGVILGIATVVMAIVIIVFVIAGLGGEGAEGP